MKISCILTSFNRPHWVRDSLASIEDQTHKDYELIVIDDSTLFDIHEILEGFLFTEVVVRHLEVTQNERRQRNRLGVNINLGLSLATGDLITFLCDDDYYFRTWFEDASRFFESNRDISVGYGKLVYSSQSSVTFATDGFIRFPGSLITEPANTLDHNQVIHRRLSPAPLWPEDVSTITAPDSVYFTKIASQHTFHPIAAFSVVKRVHDKNLQVSAHEYLDGSIHGIREGNPRKGFRVRRADASALWNE